MIVNRIIELGIATEEESNFEILFWFVYVFRINVGSPNNYIL